VGEVEQVLAYLERARAAGVATQDLEARAVQLVTLWHNAGDCLGYRIAKRAYLREMAWAGIRWLE
jgi:hypothetical protein